MARPKSPYTEESKVKSLRLPVRVWELLEKVTRKEYRTVNQQILKLVEDWLISEGHMKGDDRKR